MSDSVQSSNRKLSDEAKQPGSKRGQGIVDIRTDSVNEQVHVACKLFIDDQEVLSSLDDERSEAVKRIFDDVLQRGIFDHIIMITHLDTVKQSWHAHELSVQKLDGKISKVMSGPPGEVLMDLSEEIGV